MKCQMLLTFWKIIDLFTNGYQYLSIQCFLLSMHRSHILKVVFKLLDVDEPRVLLRMARLILAVSPFLLSPLTLLKQMCLSVCPRYFLLLSWGCITFVQANISHLRTQVNENLAQGLFFGRLVSKTNIFNILILRGLPIWSSVKKLFVLGCPRNDLPCEDLGS